MFGASRKPIETIESVVQWKASSIGSIRASMMKLAYVGVRVSPCLQAFGDRLIIRVKQSGPVVPFHVLTLLITTRHQ